MSGERILVVEDDPSTRRFLSDLLDSRGYKVECAASGEEALTQLSSGDSPALAILDLLLPGMPGLEVLARIKQGDAAQPVIILSSLGQTKTVVEAMKRGASDYLVKPFEEQELELAIENVLEKQKLRDEVKSLRRQLDAYQDRVELSSTNPKILKIKEIARQVADTDVPVLLLGESGVGKEVFARYLFVQSKRHNKAFIKVNCAALPNDLLESELFGYERGAFTGALTEKPGKFELADKGFILLDEIAEMSTHLQAKLLHVLQDGEYCRLGGKRSIRVDSRVLASTNRRLDEMVADGEFREDLFYRLNVIQIEIPPLRERKEDIPLLCAHFFKKYKQDYKSSVEELPRELLAGFIRFEWPGNVRQLENAVKRYLILPDLEMALAELVEPALPLAADVPGSSASLKEVSAKVADRAEREMALRILEETNWNRKSAARKLGISYKALLNKLKRWQVDNRAKTSAAG